jgi:hypothetical protein
MLDWYQILIWGFVIVAAVWLDFKVVRYLKVNKDRLIPITIFGRQSHLLSGIYTYAVSISKYRVRMPISVSVNGITAFNPIEALKFSSIQTEKARLNILTRVLPVILICTWALWVGRGYLDFDQVVFPNGGDLPLQIYGHFGWIPLTQCGTCAFWNGYINGGQPTFAEVQGATLHPLVMLTTLFWGAVNGSKIIAITSLIMIGLAQWWLSRVMGLGILAGLWAATMAVVGGQLSDRMGGGMVNIVFASASAALILPPLVDFLQNPKIRSAVLVGVFLGLTLLAGQGYIQLAVLFGLFPAVAVYWFSHENKSKLRNLLLFSLALSILISAVLWVPVANFMSSFTKHGDPYLANAQAFDLIPLNLVLRQEKSLFIGWIPVLLAFLTLHLVPRDKKKLVVFFFLAITILFFISSSNFLQFAHKYIDQIGSLRFPDNMSTPVVPLVLALAAWSLDHLLKSKLNLSLKTQSSEIVNFRFTWILFPLIMLLSLPPVYKFSQWRYNTHRVERPEAAMTWLNTEHTEWVGLPMPDFDWAPLAMQRGYKLTNVYRPWLWKNRTMPAPYLEATKDEVENSEMKIDILSMVRFDENRYAAISTPDGSFFPCKAAAVGGHIDVNCNSDRPGILVVKENYFWGWTVRIDGNRTVLYKDDWLKVSAPAGVHDYSFRYQPWDVWAGMALSLIGIIIAVIAWRKERG